MLIAATISYGGTMIYGDAIKKPKQREEMDSVCHETEKKKENAEMMMNNHEISLTLHGQASREKFRLCLSTSFIFFLLDF